MGYNRFGIVVLCAIGFGTPSPISGTFSDNGDDSDTHSFSPRSPECEEQDNTASGSETENDTEDERIVTVKEAQKNLLNEKPTRQERAWINKNKKKEKQKLQKIKKKRTN